MAENKHQLIKYIGFGSASALVVANIIGSGIFTTTGFQASDLGHPGLIMLLWVVGGILAFCGALCYAELGAAIPHAGGEYVYLRETYGKPLGFMSAFVSLIAGFSAPIAAAIMGLVRYAGHFIPILRSDHRILGILNLNDVVAIALVWLLAAIHLKGARRGMHFNDLITLFKVCGIVLIILAAFMVGNGDVANLTTVSPVFENADRVQRFSAFGTSLIFVMFCYTGWNASAYVVSEMKNPQKDLPRSLLVGTGIVVLLYLGLNLVYFYGADVNGLAGQVEVGLVAASRLFGDLGVSLTTLVLCVSITASASAMTIAGPRVYYAFGKDFLLLKALADTGEKSGVPQKALILQAVVTSVIILTGRMDQIQQYAGFTLSLFSSLAVSCVIVLRWKQPHLERPFKTWGYPVTPLLFLGVSGWTMFWAFRGRPAESGLALLTVLSGGILFYLLSRRWNRKT